MSKESRKNPTEITLTDFLKNTPHLNEVEEKEISQYVTNVFESKDKKKIYVFDNLFPNELVIAMHNYVTQKCILLGRRN